MLKESIKKKMQIGLFLCVSASLNSQTEASGFYQKKNELTIATSYTSKTSNRFFRGTELTSGNPEDLGEISSSITSLFSEYGINDWLSTSINLPYIYMNSKAEQPDPVSNKTYAQGIQDIGVFFKGKIIDKKIKSLGSVTLGASTGVTVPLSNYEEKGVLSIGNSATSINTYTILQFTSLINIFTELQIGYNFKESHYFNVPDANTYGFKLGYLHDKFYTHAQLAIFNSTDGFDIGSPEFIEAGKAASLPETEVDFTKLNFNVYIPIYNNKIGVSLAYDMTLDGRNFSKESSGSLGLVYKPFIN